MQIDKTRTEEQILKENEELEEQNILFEQELKQVYKDIRGLLWLWFILPLFGLIIFMYVYNNRKALPEHNELIVGIKSKIAKNELKIMINNRILEERKKVSE